MFYETGVPKYFAKFTGKHLGWSHVLINLQAFTENHWAIPTTASGTHEMYQDR